MSIFDGISVAVTSVKLFYDTPFTKVFVSGGGVVHKTIFSFGIKPRFPQSLSTWTISVIAQDVDVSHVTQTHIVPTDDFLNSYPQTHKAYTHYYL